MYIKDFSLDKIDAYLTDFGWQADDLLVFLFGEATDINYESLVELLNERNVRFVGGIFPGIIDGTQNYTEGCLINKFDLVGQPFTISGLDKDAISLPDFSSILKHQGRKLTALVLVDGLSSNIASLLREIHNTLGHHVNFIGGGAGSISLEQSPCLISNDGFYQDKAIICFLDYNVHLGVKHGWKQLKGPIVATKTRKNIIYELNWQNAFKIYSEVVNEDNKKVLTPEHFFDTAKHYPFGINRKKNEDIVRDPIAVTEDGGLVCVGEVPENTVLYILKGEKNELIAASGTATANTLADHEEKVDHMLLVDCISRVLFLGDDFSEELTSVNKQLKHLPYKVRPQGVLSLGEISSYGDGLVEFFNKTFVVGALYK